MASNQKQAVFWLLAAISSFATLDTMAKIVTKTYPLTLTVWFRYAIPTLVLGLWLWKTRGSQCFKSPHPWLQFSRGAVLVLSTITFWTALKFLPLVEAAVVSFIGPTFVVVLSALVLRERPEPIHWVALGLGFVGVMIVLRPGFSHPGIGAVAALGAAFFYSIYQVLTRKIAAKTDAWVMLFYANAIGAALLSLLLLLAGNSFLRLPLASEWLYVLGLGALGAFGHWCMIRAYELADAPTLAPFMYLQLVIATLYGWFVFHTLPDGYTLLGMLVIIGSGLIVLFDMRRQGKPEPEPANAPE